FMSRPRDVARRQPGRGGEGVRGQHRREEQDPERDERQARRQARRPRPPHRFAASATHGREGLRLARPPSIANPCYRADLLAAKRPTNRAQPADHPSAADGPAASPLESSLPIGKILDAVGAESHLQIAEARAALALAAELAECTEA